MITKKHNRAGILCYWDTEAQNTKSRLEEYEQIDLVSHFRHRWPGPGKLSFHPINESKSAPQYRAKLNKAGILKGASDWIILYPAGFHPYMVLELKRANKKEAATISQEQKEFLLAAESVTAFACVAYGYKAALVAIEEYFNLAVDD